MGLRLSYFNQTTVHVYLEMVMTGRHCPVGSLQMVNSLENGFGTASARLSSAKTTGSQTTGWSRGWGQGTWSQLTAVSPHPKAAFSMLVDEIFTVPMSE